jgi:acetamidase/formamidase
MNSPYAESWLHNQNMIFRLRGFLFCLVVPAVQAAEPRTVRYEPGLDDLKFVYGQMPEAVRVRPGDIIETKTADAEGKAFEARGRKAKGPNPLTGPFYVVGAAPGDTLAVRFLSMSVEGDEGWGGAGPGFGALNSTTYTPMLGGGIPNRNWVYRIDKSSNSAIFKANDSDFSVKIPLRPFLGCVGVAPATGEARSSIVPAEFGGNMDASEASAGNTLYLPVNVPGALLFLGDGHGAMGDGEVAGTAVEVAMSVRVQVDVIKGKKIAWPRFENADYIMGVGIYRPLDDALRIAFTQLVGWIHEDYDLSEMDAYELLSKTAEVHVAEMVDPNYVIVAKINKKFLPARGAATRP